MKQISIFFFFIGCYYYVVEANLCRRPDVERVHVYIYSSIGKVPVQLNRCLIQNANNAYSDITNQCLNATKKGISKTPQEHEQTTLVEEYITKADLVKNELYLKSGSICKYNRGFCYEPTSAQPLDGQVWEVLEKPLIKCPAKVHTVFEGEVDLWFFKKQELTYLFYYNSKGDEAFYLTLTEKDKCQDNEVWYTDEGYIVSLKSLESEKITGNYFATKSKQIVGEAILKNCDLRSINLYDFTKKIDIDYLYDSHNFFLFFKKYQDVIKQSEEHILEIVNNETLSTIETINGKLHGETDALRTLFNRVNNEISEIRKSLDTDDGKVDMDKLSKQIASLFEKNKEFDEIQIQLIQANKKLNQQLNSKNLDLEKLIDKVELIQTVINGHIPDFISKSEVIDKLEEIEINFNQQIKELAANVTRAMLDHEAREAKAKAGVKGGVKGGSNGVRQTRYELEEFIIEKLKSYNEDQCEAAIKGLTDKTKVFLDMLTYETHTNTTIVEERILRKIHELSLENEPLVIKLKEVDEKIVEIYKEIESNKKSLSDFKDVSEKDIEALKIKVDNLFIKESKFETMIKELEYLINSKFQNKQDFTPETEKLKIWVNEKLKSRDERLDSLEIITVHLNEHVKTDFVAIEEIKIKILDIIEALKKFDTIKGDVLHELENNYSLVQNNITTLYQLLEEQSQIQAQHSKTVESQKNADKSQLEKLVDSLKDIINNVKVDVDSNSERISRIVGEDLKDDDSFDALKKELITQETDLKELENLVTDQKAECQNQNQKNIGIINNLKENITELYDIIKKHEDTILIIQKQKENEKMTESSSEESSSEEDNVKGQTKGSGHGNGHGYGNGHGHGHHGFPYGWHKRSKNNYLSSHVKTHSPEEASQMNEDVSIIVQRQDEEIKNLKNLISDATLTIKTQDNKIKHLEEKLENVLQKVESLDYSTSHHIRNIVAKTVTQHVELVSLETELKSRISKCCGSTKSNVKTAGVKTAGVKTAAVKTYNELGNF